MAILGAALLGLGACQPEASIAQCEGLCADLRVNQTLAQVALEHHNCVEALGILGGAREEFGEAGMLGCFAYPGADFGAECFSLNNEFKGLERKFDDTCEAVRNSQPDALNSADISYDGSED